jgi:hypothetical protein
MQKDYIKWSRESLKVYVSLGQIQRPARLEKQFEALQHPHKWKDTKMAHFKSKSSWVFVTRLILELSHDPKLHCYFSTSQPKKALPLPSMDVKAEYHEAAGSYSYLHAQFCEI